MNNLFGKTRHEGVLFLSTGLTESKALQDRFNYTHQVLNNQTGIRYSDLKRPTSNINFFEQTCKNSKSRFEGCKNMKGQEKEETKIFSQLVALSLIAFVLLFVVYRVWKSWTTAE